ncbi:ribosome recycling factor [Coemansia reversa NRRL 1564]|uniref:Ribosome recycling factor n=1 Tax=Coemansia reversa (strain ATCC 12441 / NRRL 1564) TaxID=763665 RepID=A0A2G5B9C9_COERN|nr:ribosome recycling factor [Coemansia reversa NRRL 1564]|eukprot:PIA15618.1 ribosome recycling factor [Coemansia reversa NRRL 1564]
MHFETQWQRRAYGSKKKAGAKQLAADEIEHEGLDDAPVDIDKTEKHMQTRVDRFASELQATRVGRANPAILDHVRIKLKSSSVPLPELALVTVKDAQNLLVIPNDPEERSVIENAIRNAGLGLNPRTDKNAVVVPVPKSTKESRERLIKGLGLSAEQARVHVRKVRQDAMKQLKNAAKSSGMDKSTLKSWEKDVQVVTDKHIDRIEQLLKAKSQEIR